MSDWCDKLANQRPKRAYYHAMNTEPDISEERAQEIFINHLTSYVQNRDIKSLGIVSHGITDSFCPSHKGFQYYSLNPINVFEHID